MRKSAPKKSDKTKDNPLNGSIMSEEEDVNKKEPEEEDDFKDLFSFENMKKFMHEFRSLKEEVEELRAELFELKY